MYFQSNETKLHSKIGVDRLNHIQFSLMLMQLVKLVVRLGLNVWFFFLKQNGYFELGFLKYQDFF